MTLIRHPQIECEGPGCRERVEVPSGSIGVDGPDPGWLPPDWHRHIFAEPGGLREEDYHSEGCLLDALIARNPHLPQVQVLEQNRVSPIGSLASDVAKQRADTNPEYRAVQEQMGMEAARKMEERTRAAGIDHMFKGEPGDILCTTCGTDHSS